MTQQQWDLIGYGVWALIIWMTAKQFLQTRKPVKGSGMKLLLGDWLLFAPVPWLVYCIGSRGTWEQVAMVAGIGVVVAIPYIVTTRFTKAADGTILFKSNLLFYLFLFGFPYVRYMIRDNLFHTHPILTGTHRPDIELMLALYIAVLVIYTFVWRLAMYTAYKRAVRRLGVQKTPSQEAPVPAPQSVR